MLLNNSGDIDGQVKLVEFAVLFLEIVFAKLDYFCLVAVCIFEINCIYILYIHFSHFIKIQTLTSYGVLGFWGIDRGQL